MDSARANKDGNGNSRFGGSEILGETSMTTTITLGTHAWPVRVTRNTKSTLEGAPDALTVDDVPPHNVISLSIWAGSSLTFEELPELSDAIQEPETA